MAKKSTEPTFAELLKQPTWSETETRETGEHAVRPGMYNAAGELFDPEGRLLALLREDVTPEQAQQFVIDGALVAHEACGCGGWTGCQPDWLTSETVEGLRSAPPPRFSGRHGAPSWIDVWSSEAAEVIYLHGDVQWSDALR